jgi:hypothetical protein
MSLDASTDTPEGAIRLATPRGSAARSVSKCRSDTQRAFVDREPRVVVREGAFAASLTKTKQPVDDETRVVACRRMQAQRCEGFPELVAFSGYPASPPLVAAHARDGR